MHVTVATDTCQAYGNCLLEAPDVFDLDDEAGVAVVLQAHPAEDLRTAVEAAVRSCPVQALTLVEGENGPLAPVSPGLETSTRAV